MHLVIVHRQNLFSRRIRTNQFQDIETYDVSLYTPLKCMGMCANSLYLKIKRRKILPLSFGLSLSPPSVHVYAPDSPKHEFCSVF
jgi:hypothetical protein